MSSTDKRIILKGLEEELTSIVAERENLTKRMTALEKAVAGVRELISLNGGALPTQQDRPLFARNTFADIGTVDAAIKYLRLIGKPQTNREVVNALLLGGKKSKAKSVSDTVRTTLLREAEKDNSRLKWTGHQWELTEWSSEK